MIPRNPIWSRLSSFLIGTHLFRLLYYLIGRLLEEKEWRWKLNLKMGRDGSCYQTENPVFPGVDERRTEGPGTTHPKALRHS